MMKKRCFYILLAMSLARFCLFSCAGNARLYDVVLSATAADETLPAGSILCYGRGYDTAADAGFLDDYLGLAGYPAFRDRIEDFALYSSLSGDFCELCVMRLYRASDAQDGALFFERRAAAAKRALNAAGLRGYAENAVVVTRGSVVILSMMPDNGEILRRVEKALG